MSAVPNFPAVAAAHAPTDAEVDLKIHHLATPYATSDQRDKDTMFEAAVMLQALQRERRALRAAIAKATGGEA
jgi:hypothetical protein